LWKLGLLLTMLLGVDAAFAESPLKVVTSGGEGMTLRIDVADWNWTTVGSDDGLREAAVPVVAGFVSGGVPGQPQFPVLGRWLAVPPGQRAVASLSDAIWEELDGRIVAPVPVPVRQPGFDERPLLGEELVFPGDEVRTGDAVLSVEELTAMAADVAREGVVSLGEMQKWRGHRIVPLTVRPLVVDRNGQARRRLVSGTVVIEFVADGKTADGARGRPDDRMGGWLLNGDSMARWATESDRMHVGPLKSETRSGTLLRPELRVPVTKTRLHRIEAARLSDLGLVDLNGIDERHVRLYQRRYVADDPGIYEEIEVPIQMVGDGGAFSGDDFFVFWGLRVRDDVAFTDGLGVHDGAGDPDEIFNPSATDEVNSGNIYYLAMSESEPAESWARMETITLPATGGTEVASYRRVDYREEDTFHGHRPADEWVDRNHWNSMMVGSVSIDIDATHPLPGRSDVRLRAGYVGLGTAPRTYSLNLNGNTDHQVGLLSGVTHVERSYDSQVSGDVVLSDWLPGAAFETFNNLTPTRMLGWLDWFELSYESAYIADDDQLKFHLGDGVGDRSVEVTGFTDPNLTLYDISDPRRPAVISLTAANVVDVGGGSWTLAITANQAEASARRFAVLAGSLSTTVPPFSYFKTSRIAHSEDPTDVVGRPDVLVITHPAFRSEAERWVNHRQERSRTPMNFHIVDIHQVFDWFSGGLKNPDAIKRLVSHAGDQWDTWAVQIFGDAYQNVRGLSETGDQRDWVPSRWHVWSQTGYENELLPADKWFVTPTAGHNYPDDTYVPPDMIIARFPCNSVAEARVMVDKAIAFEAADAGEAWKARSIWVADDAWSEGYQDQGSAQSFHSNEVTFTTSQNSLATRWESFGCDAADWCGTMGLASDRVLLADDLDPLSPPTNQTRSLYEFWDLCELHVLPRFFSAMNQGAMMLHYQGHANDYQMAHERIFYDTEVFQERSDVDDLANTGRPWIFVGLGCHLASWARDGVESNPRTLPSIGEKLLRKGNAGAVAVYASPGYEFLTNNATFAAVMGNVWLDHPPRDLAGPSGRSRWILGELFLASEAELLALGTGVFSRRLVAQYALLGDGLMTLDAAPPRLQVLQDWEPIDDGAELQAKDASNQLVLTIQALDEAGIDRLVVRDGDGVDVSATITGGTPEGAESDQYVEWEVRIPIDPSDQELVFHVYDTGDATDNAPHATTTIRLPTSIVLYRDGQLFTPGQASLPTGTPLTFNGRGITASWIDENAVFTFDGQDLTVVSGSATRIDEHMVDFEFVVEVDGNEPQVLLRIDGAPMLIPLSADGGMGVLASGISDLNVYPNPVRDEARILFRTDAAPSPGVIHVYTLAGHRLASLPVRVGDFHGDGRVLVEWDGRDGEGDLPANGVYLYRVELHTVDGSVASDMQRLVLMH